MALIILVVPAVAAAQTPHFAPPVPSPPAATPIAVGPEVKISLAEAVALALRDNRTIQSAYLGRVAQRFNLVVAKSQFWPKMTLDASIERSRAGGVGASATTLTPTATWTAPTGAQVTFGWASAWTRAGNQIQDAAGGGGSVGRNTSAAGVKVTQPLLRGAGTEVNLANLRVAEIQERINTLALKSTVSDTVTAIILAYRGLQQAKEQLQLARAALERSKSLLDVNGALIAAGRMAAADLVQAEADVANQEVALLQAEQTRNTAQLALLRLLAVDLHTNLVAEDRIDAPHLAIPLDRVIALGLGNRMDVLAQRMAIEQDRQGLLVARNNRLWDLSAVATLQRDRGIAGGGGSTSGTLGLQLSVPIGDYTRPQQEIQATTTLRVAQTQLADLEQRAEASIRDAVQGVELSWRQLDAARRAKSLAAKALEVARAKFQAGRSANFEVLSFEAALRAAETQALTAAIVYLNALSGLDQQLGTTLDTWRISLNE